MSPDRPTVHSHHSQRWLPMAWYCQQVWPYLNETRVHFVPWAPGNPHQVLPDIRQSAQNTFLLPLSPHHGVPIPRGRELLVPVSHLPSYQVLPNTRIWWLNVPKVLHRQPLGFACPEVRVLPGGSSLSPSAAGALAQRPELTELRGCSEEHKQGRGLRLKIPQAGNMGDYKATMKL